MAENVNILLISFLFPPYSHSGIQRPLKISRDLPQFGYNPVILTCGNMMWDSYDFETWENEVKGRLDVHKTNAARFESINHSYLSSWIIDKLVLKLETYFLEDRLDWALSVRKAALQLVKRKNIKLIYTTGPPQSVHFLGYWLKLKTGLPWVMEFRDPLVTPKPVVKVESFGASLLWKLRYRILFRIYEKLWMESADAIISVTPGMTTLIRKNHRKLAAKVSTVTNGYDEQDFRKAILFRPNPSVFNVIYTGRFYPSKTHKHFFKSLKIALSLFPDLRKKLRIFFVGYCEPEFTSQMSQPEFKNVIRYLGAMDHYKALGYQMGGDVNLLLIPVENQYALPGKFFEYMRSGKPILAVCGKGQVRTTVEEYNLGVVVHPKQHEKVAQALHNLYRKWEDKTLDSYKTPGGLLRTCERWRLTRSVSEVFNTVINQASIHH